MDSCLLCSASSNFDCSFCLKFRSSEINDSYSRCNSFNLAAFLIKSFSHDFKEKVLKYKYGPILTSFVIKDWRRIQPIMSRVLFLYCLSHFLPDSILAVLVVTSAAAVIAIAIAIFIYIKCRKIGNSSYFSLIVSSLSTCVYFRLQVRRRFLAVVSSCLCVMRLICDVSLVHVWHWFRINVTTC